MQRRTGGKFRKLNKRRDEIVHRIQAESIEPGEAADALDIAMTEVLYGLSARKNKHPLRLNNAILSLIMNKQTKPAATIVILFSFLIAPANLVRAQNPLETEPKLPTVRVFPPTLLKNLGDLEEAFERIDFFSDALDYAEDVKSDLENENPPRGVPFSILEKMEFLGVKKNVEQLLVDILNKVQAISAPPEQGKAVNVKRLASPDGHLRRQALSNAVTDLVFRTEQLAVIRDLIELLRGHKRYTRAVEAHMRRGARTFLYLAVIGRFTPLEEMFGPEWYSFERIYIPKMTSIVSSIDSKEAELQAEYSARIAALNNYAGNMIELLRSEAAKLSEQDQDNVREEQRLEARTKQLEKIQSDLVLEKDDLERKERFWAYLKAKRDETREELKKDKRKARELKTDIEAQQSQLANAEREVQRLEQAIEQTWARRNSAVNALQAVQNRMCPGGKTRSSCTNDSHGEWRDNYDRDFAVANGAVSAAERDHQARSGQLNNWKKVNNLDAMRSNIAQREQEYQALQSSIPSLEREVKSLNYRVDDAESGLYDKRQSYEQKKRQNDNDFAEHQKEVQKLFGDVYYQSLKALIQANQADTAIVGSITSGLSR